MSRTNDQKKADENFLKSIKTEMHDLIEEVDAFKKKERIAASAILTKHRNPPKAKIIGKVDEFQILNKLYEDILSPLENSGFDTYTQTENQDKKTQEYETKKINKMKENYKEFSKDEKKNFNDFYDKYTKINQQNNDLKERINTIYTNITNKIQYYQDKQLNKLNPLNIFQLNELNTLKGYKNDISPYYETISDYLISDNFANLLQEFLKIKSENQTDPVENPGSTGGKRRRRSTKKRKSSKKSRKARRSRRHRRNRSSKK